MKAELTTALIQLLWRRLDKGRKSRRCGISERGKIMGKEKSASPKSGVRSDERRERHTVVYGGVQSLGLLADT